MTKVKTKKNRKKDNKRSIHDERKNKGKCGEWRNKSTFDRYSRASAQKSRLTDPKEGKGEKLQSF
jgi:hypothetical protein